MIEHYFHEAVDGGVQATNRLRAVERTTDDGYKITAGKRGDDSISLKLESGAWGRAEDVLSAAERVSLAKLLLSGLTRDQILTALPDDLLTANPRGIDDDADEQHEVEELITEYMTAEPQNRAGLSLTTWITGGLMDNAWRTPSQIEADPGFAEDFMEEVDPRIFALLVPEDAPEVSFTHTFVAAEGGRVTAQAFGDGTDGQRVWEYSQVFEPTEPGGDDAAMEFLFALRATAPGAEHQIGFKQKRVDA